MGSPAAAPTEPAGMAPFEATAAFTGQPGPPTWTPEPDGADGAASPSAGAWEPPVDATRVAGQDATRVDAAAWDPGAVGPFAVGSGPQVAPGPEATATYGGGGAWQPTPVDPPAAAPGRVNAGTLGTPGAAVLDERGNLPGGVAGLVAAALVTIGVFLPWIAVEGRDVSGWAASGDAKVLLGIAAVATVIAALLIGGARSLVLRLGLVGLGVVALGLGAYEIVSAGGIDEFDVSLGIGLVVVLAGGLALAVAGGLTRHKRFL